MEEKAIASLNELFKERHELNCVSIGVDYHKSETTFQEEDNNGTRQFVNLTKKAYEFTESIAPEPTRAKGKHKFRLVSDFVASILSAAAITAPKYVPFVEISAQPKPIKGSNFARVAYNATTFTGALGHGDWGADLVAIPEPSGQAWVNAALDGESLPFTKFAELVYRAGAAVVDSGQWPEEIKNLASRLKLTLANSLADLLALESGLDGTGEFEESVTVDPHTGDSKQVVARKSKPKVVVPKGVIIAWEPFTGYTKPVLLRLAYRIVDGVATFTLHPVNLDTACIEVADNLQEDLLGRLEGTDIAVYQTA